MSYGFWKPSVPVAKRQEQAQKAVAKAKKSGQDFHPVVIEGRTIAKTVWGKAWCDNLEAYSDYASRLPRGRSYVRNGSVIDLKIEPGKVRAQVVGSSLYQIDIDVAAVADARWKSLAEECASSISSLVELLQGKLLKSVMERICAPKTGLFPAPNDIRLHCSCPDWATMCKHVAAVLYGVGARLDAQPELLFTLRQVDPSELVTQAAGLSVRTRTTPARDRVLDNASLADVFGIDLVAIPQGNARPSEVSPSPVKGRTHAASRRKRAEPSPQKDNGNNTAASSSKARPKPLKAPSAKKKVATQPR